MLGCCVGGGRGLAGRGGREAAAVSAVDGAWGRVRWGGGLGRVGRAGGRRGARPGAELEQGWLVLRGGGRVGSGNGGFGVSGAPGEPGIGCRAGSDASMRLPGGVAEDLGLRIQGWCPPSVDETRGVRGGVVRLPVVPACTWGACARVGVGAVARRRRALLSPSWAPPAPVLSDGAARPPLRLPRPPLAQAAGVVILPGYLVISHGVSALPAFLQPPTATDPRKGAGSRSPRRKRKGASPRPSPATVTGRPEIAGLIAPRPCDWPSKNIRWHAPEGSSGRGDCLCHVVRLVCPEALSQLPSC